MPRRRLQPLKTVAPLLRCLPDDGPFTLATPTKWKVTGTTQGKPREKKSWEAPVEEVATSTPKKEKKKKKMPEEESTSKPKKKKKKKKKVTKKEARHSNIEADTACHREDEGLQSGRKAEDPQ